MGVTVLSTTVHTAFLLLGLAFLIVHPGQSTWRFLVMHVALTRRPAFLVLICGPRWGVNVVLTRVTGRVCAEGVHNSGLSMPRDPRRSGLFICTH